MEGGASRKGRRTNRWTVVPGDVEEKDGLRPTDRLLRVKTWARGKRKNENRRTDGRTLDKQGAIEINREYCEEYAQTRNTHSSSPSTFSSTPYLPILSLLYSSLFPSLPPSHPFDVPLFAFVCSNARVFPFPDLRRSFGIRFYKRRAPLLLRSRFVPAPSLIYAPRCFVKDFYSDSLREWRNRGEN